MFTQHPIYPLVFSVILAAVILKQCILRRKFLKNRLMLSFILIFILAMFSIFYEDIKKNDFIFMCVNYSLIGIDVLIGLFFFFNIDVSLSKEHFQNEIISSLNNTHYFFIHK